MKTSVVMAVHGNWPVVERAVVSLQPALGPERELIVVDDASPDGTGERVAEELSYATVLRNDQNIGFGPSCNRGAQHAHGEHLCFVNSDVLVEPGALDALERALAEPGTGAVAATFLENDGKIQEAGSAIGCDGVTYPLGRGADRTDPQWSFRREIDFGSAACLLVRRADFAGLGGFDDAYAPGYYEDADLCLRLAERGLRTLVEPAAQVVHLQYGSGTQERAKGLVRRNRPIFLARWGDRFAYRPIVVAGKAWTHRALALRDAITLTRFLVFHDSGLADDLARQWPGSRVTLVGPPGEALEGIELVVPEDIESWLEERRFHYSAVLGSHGELADALDRSQPQAIRIPSDSRGDLVGAVVVGGVAPPGAEPHG